MTIVGVSS